jgi:hypothetical protein
MLSDEVMVIIQQDSLPQDDALAKFSGEPEERPNTKKHVETASIRRQVRARVSRPRIGPTKG